MLRIAYITGLIVGPFALLIATYAVNASGPEVCSYRDDITFNGRRVMVEHCTGKLGLAARDPAIVTYLD